MARNTKPTLRWLLEEGVVGETYDAYGWVRTKRDSKTVSFLALNDGSTITNLQAVLPAELEGIAATLEPVGTGASVRVTGELVESPGKGQRVELVALRSIEVEGASPRRGATFAALRSWTPKNKRAPSPACSLRRNWGAQRRRFECAVRQKDAFEPLRKLVNITDHEFATILEEL